MFKVCLLKNIKIQTDKISLHEPNTNKKYQNNLSYWNKLPGKRVIIKGINCNFENHGTYVNSYTKGIGSDYNQLTPVKYF